MKQRGPPIAGSTASAWLLMPLRIATGNAAVWQIVVAAALLAATTYVVLRTAAAIYARTRLQRGRRISWRQSLHLRAS